MSCSQCYTAQVPECIGELLIYAKIDDDITDILIKITDSHGNVFYLDAKYLDEIITIDIANSNLPKNLFNRYSGAIKIEVYDKYLQTQLQMSFCDNPTIYDCIVIDKIEMNNDVENITTSTIGCVS